MSNEWLQTTYKSIEASVTFPKFLEFSGFVGTFSLVTAETGSAMGSIDQLMTQKPKHDMPSASILMEFYLRKMDCSLENQFLSEEWKHPFYIVPQYMF